MISNSNQLELFQDHLNSSINLSIFKNTKDVQAISAEKTMREIIRKLTTPIVTNEKDTILVGPYSLGENKIRRKNNVTAITGLFFDIDDSKSYKFEHLINLFNNFFGIIHSTWSHTLESPRYRLLICISEPIEVEKYQQVRSSFLEKNPELASIVDPACKDLARAYYQFSYPPERAHMAQCAVLMGRPVNPGSYVSPYANLISAIESNKAIDHNTLALIGSHNSKAESLSKVANLKNALSFLSSDVEYGCGKFHDQYGTPEPGYWLAAIWAIASLGWPSGKDIARKWSQQSSRYTDDGFEKAWNKYNPMHANGIRIGSLYKRAKELGWNHESVQPEPNTTALTQCVPRFTLLDIDELGALPPADYLVKGILPSSGLAAIYGPSGSGKTFLALDLMMAIACQSDWFGHKVKNVPVTYVGLEGKGGINKRIQAWRIKNPSLTPSNFKIILDNFDLMKAVNVEELAQAIIAAQMHKGVIVIDTLNQASPAADENSSQDMGIIIKHLKLLQEMTLGLVLIVHHTGKNTSQGLRGHSSLKAALDANIEVVGGDKRSWLLEKSKDGEDGKNFGFRLEVQNLGFDSDGDPITSCTVERDNSAIFAKLEPTGRQQKVALKVVKQALSNSATNRITVEAAVFEIAKSQPAVAANKRNNNARRLLSSLIGGGFLSSELIDDEGWVWLP